MPRTGDRRGHREGGAADQVRPRSAPGGRGERPYRSLGAGVLSRKSTPLHGRSGALRGIDEAVTRLRRRDRPRAVAPHPPRRRSVMGASPGSALPRRRPFALRLLPWAIAVPGCGALGAFPESAPVATTRPPSLQPPRPSGAFRQGNYCSARYRGQPRRRARSRALAVASATPSSGRAGFSAGRCRRGVLREIAEAFGRSTKPFRGFVAMKVPRTFMLRRRVRPG